jgi:hypothetical protein
MATTPVKVKKKNSALNTSLYAKAADDPNITGTIEAVKKGALNALIQRPISNPACVENVSPPHFLACLIF